MVDAISVWNKNGLVPDKIVKGLGTDFQIAEE
jgi:hypothetical protein